MWKGVAIETAHQFYKYLISIKIYSKLITLNYFGKVIWILSTLYIEAEICWKTLFYPLIRIRLAMVFTFRGCLVVLIIKSVYQLICFFRKSMKFGFLKNCLLLSQKDINTLSKHFKTTNCFSGEPIIQ